MEKEEWLSSRGRERRWRKRWSWEKGTRRNTIGAKLLKQWCWVQMEQYLQEKKRHLSSSSKVVCQTIKEAWIRWLWMGGEDLGTKEGRAAKQWPLKTVHLDRKSIYWSINVSSRYFHSQMSNLKVRLEDIYVELEQNNQFSVTSNCSSCCHQCISHKWHPVCKPTWPTFAIFQNKHLST